MGDASSGRSSAREAAARARTVARGEARLLRKRWRNARRLVRRACERRHRPTYGRSLAHVPSRDEIPELLNRRGLLGDAVEIGVKAGRYSELLLSSWRGRRLVSVDPWLAADPEAYVDRANVAQDQHERYCEQTKRRLARHGPRSEIWRLTSTQAAQRVARASLDFVYIDARHDYASVLEDLEAWFPRVRPGGIIAGHDYCRRRLRLRRLRHEAGGRRVLRLPRPGGAQHQRALVGRDVPQLARGGPRRGRRRAPAVATQAPARRSAIYSRMVWTPASAGP